MYKAFIFDLDGTLVDTINYIAVNFNKVLEMEGFPPNPSDLYNTLVGDGTRILAERAIDLLIKKGEVNPSQREEVIEKVHDNYLYRYRTVVDDISKPYEGIVEVLETLRNKGIKIAICTNKPVTPTEIVLKEAFDFTFDAVSAVEEGGPRKPDPKMVEAILKDLNIRKEEALYLGDTSTDMITGKNAGLDTVGVTWGFRDRAELESYKPLKVIDKPYEMLEFIEK